MNTAIDADDGNPVLRSLVCAAMKEWKARLASIVEDGIAEGEIRDGVEPRRIANTIIATLEGALMISRLEGNRTAVQDARETLELMLGGIAAA
ncbi:TetR family transcriptional regulator C-terminal domain-containing protein [Tunturiibacter gelidiferens]|uniref:TetR family transcriptional regulator C-terminal domain-containing protein n=1 Tax=Tunturiibacter gelidiferens TaxID=3069689 RepID=UPI003D9BAEAD